MEEEKAAAGGGEEEGGGARRRWWRRVDDGWWCWWCVVEWWQKAMVWLVNGWRAATPAWPRRRPEVEKELGQRGDGDTRPGGDRLPLGIFTPPQIFHFAILALLLFFFLHKVPFFFNLSPGASFLHTQVPLSFFFLFT